MPRHHRLDKTTFSGGELHPRLHGRYDITAFATGSAKLTNCRIRATGAASRRPGFRRVADLTAGEPVRLRPFVFSRDQKYLMAFRPGAVDVYTIGTAVSLATTVSGPWTADQVPELYTAHAGDTMLVVHGDMAPQVLRRTGASTFTVEPLDFEESLDGLRLYQPYYKFAPANATLTASAVSGSVTLTSSVDVFAAGHVNTRWRMRDDRRNWRALDYKSGTAKAIPGETVTHGDTGAAGIVRRVDGTVQAGTLYLAEVKGKFPSGGAITGDQGAAFSTVAADYMPEDDVFAQWVEMTITGVTDARTATASVHGTLDSATATPEWEEPAFSAVRGYPQTVTFHQGRTVYAGTPSLPSHVFASKVEAYFNHDTGEAEADDAVQIAPRAEQVTAVRGIASTEDLVLFTDSAETYVDTDGKPFAPTTVRFVPQTRYGSAAVPPLHYDGAILFVQSGGGAVREFIFADAEQAYHANEVSLLSSHLVPDPVDMTVVRASPDVPEVYVYVLNRDGTLAVFHSIRAEKVASWAPWTTEGAFTAVCGVDADLFVATEREIDGVTRAFLEQIDPTLTLDCGKTATLVEPGTSFPGFSHLAGATVDVTSETYYLGRHVVAGDGTITTQVPVRSIDAGFGPAVRIAELPRHFMIGNGVFAGSPVRIGEVVIRLDATLSMEAEGQRLIVRQVTDDMSVAPSPVDGTHTFTFFGWEVGNTFEIEQTEPLPLTVLGYTMEVVTP